MTTILQVPMDKELRDKATLVAQDWGFSSLQEAVRIFLNKMAKRQMDIELTESVQLSPKAIRRYNKIINEIESGKVKMKSFTNTEDLLRHLSK